jgi:hypothetical protein
MLSGRRALPAGSACAASSVPATGLSLRSLRAGRDLSRPAGALWCGFAGAALVPAGEHLARPGRPVMRVLSCAAPAA